MVIVTVYKIFNYVDVTDKDFYVGCTRHLCSRWSNHKHSCKNGIDRKLYNHMREKGIEQFKCIIIHSQEIDDKDVDSQKSLEQKYIDELKPTLNINNVNGSLDYAVAELRILTPINESRQYNSDYEKKLAMYHQAYHKAYHPIYYANNKDKLKAKCNKYNQVNRENISKYKKKYNAEIKKLKKFYCETCDLALASAGALKMHDLSKSHFKKIENKGDQKV
jgi:hypothetical protein